ncbi:MAG: hypothetical protein QOK16_3884 [Solirubrobacteraceae bacterium]|jgi:uncharacterized protein YkwD|nr:hypothetical protein [Solirubrobacteraceae bacterium]
MTHRKDAIAGTILLLLVMALNTSAAWATKRVATDACPAPAVADARFREAITILCLVNRERTTRGLTAVRVSQQLSQSALAHTKDMVEHRFFGHGDSAGLNFRQRVARSGYVRNSSTYIAETLAWGSFQWATPEGLMGSLMSSPPHKRAILDGRFRDIGVGLIDAVPFPQLADAGATLTLQFGRR